MRRKGFTLIELLVVIGIIGILVTMLLPELAKIRQTAFFTACQSNLRSIGTAMAAYRQDENDRMPVYQDKPVSDTAVNDAPKEGVTETDYGFGDTEATSATDTDWTVLEDQAMQNVWLLVASDALAEGMFRCPADDDWQERGSDAKKYGWTNEYQYSYGMQWPYARNQANDKNSARLGTPSTVMMADFNPADYEDTEGIGGDGADEPSNHRNNGTNVSLASGGADKYTNTDNSLAGSGNDDIYTAGPKDSAKAGYMPGSIPKGADRTYEARKDSAIALGGRTESPGSSSTTDP